MHPLTNVLNVISDEEDEDEDQEDAYFIPYEKI